MAAGTPPPHHNRRIGNGRDKETEQGNRRRIAESLAQFTAGPRVLWTQVEFLKGLAGHWEDDALRSLVFAEVVRSGDIGLLAGTIGHGG